MFFILQVSKNASKRGEHIKSCVLHIQHCLEGLTADSDEEEGSVTANQRFVGYFFFFRCKLHIIIIIIIMIIIISIIRIRTRTNNNDI